MAWLVAQVWVLCAVAYLLGSAVTWLLFVRPHRSPAPGHPAPPHPVREPAVPGGPRPEPAVPDVPLDIRASDPALAALDGPTLTFPAVPGAGTRASGALDLLGVARSGTQPPVIPTQAGPPDGDAAPHPR